MSEITGFADVHAILQRHITPPHGLRKAYTLERMTALMTALGNPQDSYKIVHIAGTSGKTSTSYYVAALLMQAGKKVGLTVSPHVDEVNERLQINLTPLPEKEFCTEFSRFYDELQATGINPTYFELLVAFAFWEFARQKVDYAVVEVGLGGLLDATNVISRPDKVCVITDIGLDHTEVLGNTVTAIAAQKAGIIRPHTPVFMYEQGDEVMGVVREVCEQQPADLHEIWELRPSDLPPNLVLFQRRNWYLALMVYDFLTQRDSLPKLNEGQLAASTAIVIPARMEIVEVGDKTVVLDGAHNTQKLSALAKSMKRKYPHQPKAVLLSLVQSKNFRLRASLKQILSLADHVIITSFKTPQDLLRNSVDPLKLAEYCLDAGFENLTIIPDPVQAYGELLKRPEPVLLVTGSFYLLNHVRPLASNLTKS